MNNRFISNQYITQVEDSSKNDSPSNSGDSDSPSSAMAKSPKIPSKIRRGAMGKRVISVPIEEVERLRLKGDHVSSPPSDSWAWRKYGQKPIKGSPYPRGYYRCSSSKACPARKQVERSRANPNMLKVTYSCEHNHPPPSSRNTHHRAPPLAAAGNSVSEEELEEEEEEEKNRDVLVSDQSQELISENKFSMINGGDQFGWLTDFESTSSVILESPVLMEERRCTEREMAMIFSMGEEDESGLFSDLGELPECSTVFRRGVGLREAEQRRRSEAMCGP